MKENIYEHIDLCEIYEPIFEPPESFLKECTQYWLSEWRKKCKPFEIPDGSYIESSDGEVHYYIKGLMIKVSERFSDNGNQINDLIEDLVVYQAKQM